MAKPKDIHALCTWKRTDTAKALSKYGLDKLFASYGIGAKGEDLFGEVPATYVHVGDVEIKSLALYAQGHGIFIIEGSLSIDGVFTFYASDAYTVLVVTGDVTATHWNQAWDTQLVVFGKTTIAGLLWLDLSDAGFALFRGPASSRDRVITNTSVEADVPMFATKPKGMLREDLHADSFDPPAMHAALLANKLPFDTTPPKSTPKNAPKKPSNQALAAMTASEFLASPTGFASAQIVDNAINPNWLGKAKAGEPFTTLSLISETYVDAFPDSLATLTQLTLLDNRDGERLATMLRSLPKLAALKKLVIAGTGLKALPPEIGALAKLEHLEVRGNKQLAAIPDEASQLKLKTLIVYDNAITQMPASLKSVPDKRVNEPKLAGW